MSVARWTALTIAAAAAVAAAAASPAVAAPKEQLATAAVAVGRSADGEATFRLVGRRLTLRLSGPITERRREWVELRCGDAFFSTPEDNETWRAQFVVSAAREVVAGSGSRTLRALLSRDVANRTNWCGIVARRGDRWDRIRPSWAWMRGVRGSVRGCRKAGRERVTFEDGPVVVARARFNDSSGEVDTYRACLRPNGRFLPFAIAYSGGGGAGGSEHPHGLLRSGRWLAWSFTSAPHFPGVQASTSAHRVRLDDTLAVEDVGSGAAVALAPNGALATLDGENERATETVITARRRLHVTAPGSREELLIATASAVTPQPGPAVEPIADVRLSSDGRVVSWTENGAARSAQVERAALATGSSDDGKASLRLEGRTLSVTLHERLVPTGFRGWPSVRLLCGEDIADSASPSPWLVVAAGRDLRVRHDLRRIDAKLDGDLARQANWCRVLYRAAGRTTRITASMALVRGTRPGCAEAAGGTVRAESEQAKLVSFGHGDEFSSEGMVRACWKASGKWRQLADFLSTKYGGTLMVSGLASRWAAWATWNTMGGDCSAITRIDLATGETEAIPVAPIGAGRPACVHDLVVAGDGRAAWAQVDGRDGLPWLRITVQAPGGQPVVVADGLVRGYRHDLALAPDGRSVTWTDGGEARSAALP